MQNMKRILPVIAVILISNSALSQSTINNYEYWFDNDYNKKVANSVSTGSTLQLNTNIETASLVSGLHIFNVRFKDNSGRWSSSKSQFFFKQSALGKISSYEYWFDDNYNQKVSANITATDNLVLIQNLNANTLTTGYHQFNIRFKDNIGNWSVVKSHSFFKTAANITISGYEYWYDDNYNQKISANVNNTNELIIIQDLNVNILNTGYHRFNIRFKDFNSTWSAVKSSYFLKLSGNGTGNIITAYRYWYDASDTTIVNVHLPLHSDIITLNDSLNTGNLNVGYHKLHYQFKDTAQLWGPVYTHQFRKVGSSRIDTITPAVGGNTGYVTCNIYGEGFYEGTKVKLTMGIDTIIVPDSMIVIKDGNQIIPTLNLIEAKVGDYDVIVSIPQMNDTIMVLKKAYKIVPGDEGNISTKIIGADAIRPGAWQNYSVILNSDGNVDVHGVALWIAIPKSFNYKLDFEFVKPDSIVNWDTISTDFDADTLFDVVNNYKVVPVWIELVPASSVMTFNINLQANSIQDNATIIAWTSPPNFYTNNFINSAILNIIENNNQEQDMFNCYLDIYARGIDEIEDQLGFPPVISCLYGAFDFAFRPLINLYYYNNANIRGFKNLGWNALSTLVGCIDAKKLNLNEASKEGLENLQKTFKHTNDAKTVEECFDAFYPEEIPQQKTISIVGAIDPNEKYGPTSLDTINRYISNLSSLNYIIQFENDSSATASAQTVRIYDTLDINVFDLSSFHLGNVTIGDTTVSFRTGVKEDSVDIDLSRLGIFYVARVKGKLIDSSGVAYWEFQTLNPYTLKPATGVFDGFLPPNTVSPKGIGEVSYNIKVYETLPLNTEIMNKAYIYFDYNPGVVTGTWKNKLDNIKPQSKIKALTSITRDSIVVLGWSGTDIGSGLLNYDIFYSINGGAYQPLTLNLKDTVFSFIGKRDSTYSFYSIAIDSALNKEDAPTRSDASTTIKFITLTETHNDVKCNGAITGSINISVTGATAPIKYQWSNGAKTEDMINIGAGNYVITVTDALGIKARDTITITQPTVITIRKQQKNETAPGAKDGSARVIPSGGTPPYSYLWNTGATTQAITGLTAGQYSCRVTDTNGCKKTTTFTISNNGILKESVDSSLLVRKLTEWDALINPNPTKGIFKLTLLGVQNEVSIIISDGLGKQVYNSNLNYESGGTIMKELNLSTLSKGTYFIIISNGAEIKRYKLVKI